ncbi:phosphoribosylamine--glycine ligase [Geitlerinema sp. PCC 9228]|uniref:phosphoribosylamine--glycine ligase n=1 Tax=Geitlerinema sp. PCC 9228 TaxID=111611 RepID=UPI0008F9AB2E|nr:phosphoribosylamine--glycine ligase [Geitlerinema sp. PCC 9228]
MNILIVGNGGREHALAWTLLRSPQVQQVCVAPGNGGTELMEGCENIPVGVTDFAKMKEAVRDRHIDLVVVGPEDPLAAGIADFFQAEGIAVFGPTQAAAQIESSKSWAKQLCNEAGIPTAAAATFSREHLDAALDYIANQTPPIVVKADGLAAGKGVAIASTVAEAQNTVRDFFGGKLGTAGNQVVIEEYLQGQEVSVLAITDGKTIRPLLPAQDHKPIGEGDTGDNTGGMGAYVPTPFFSSPALDTVKTEILEKAIAAMQKRGIDYRGVLYAGLIVSPQGDIKVLEFNCRFGDPETQAILPILETPLDSLMLAVTQQKLDQHPPIRWKSSSAACVVVASGGYPGSYAKGYPITGIAEAEETGALVFHAGTQIKDQQLVTSGGRVLGVTGLGDHLAIALENSYQALSKINFTNCYYRRDIGYQVLETQNSQNP